MPDLEPAERDELAAMLAWIEMLRGHGAQAAAWAAAALEGDLDRDQAPQTRAVLAQGLQTSGRGDLGRVGIRATVSRAGIELGSAAVCGMEWSFDDREMFERVDFPDVARDVVSEAMTTAQKARAALCGRTCRK